MKNNSKWSLDSLEMRLRKLTIPHLMRYIIFGNALVYFLALFNNQIIFYLNLLPDEVMKGQVWRLVTFVFVPSMSSPLLTILSLFCYYWIGNALERAWGAFRFNLFFFVDYIAVIAVIFIFKPSGDNITTVYHQAGYIMQSMFLALATLYPETRVLIMYFIPAKAKWIGFISAALLVYEFIVSGISGKMLILASMLGYMIFFLPGMIQNIKNRARRREYQQKVQAGFRSQAASATPLVKPFQSSGGKVVGNVAFHRCHVCGMTELDNPNLIFRYCSQCNGNYEYCENHIHNHMHVQ